MEPAVHTRKLTRSFDRVHAVQDVDLDVPAGAVYGFLGRNGAGKTTTIRMLLGLLRPSAGHIEIHGLDALVERRRAACLIGSMVETPGQYGHLSGRRNLRLTADLLGLPRSAVDRALDIVDLTGDADRRVGDYSLGMRQRLGVARALLARPRLLVLDEPTNGLDPRGVRDMRRLLREMPAREGVTVFVSSHALGEIDQIATHVGLMHEGRLILQAPVEELRQQHRTAIEIEIETTQPQQAAALLREAGITARVDGARLVLPGCEHATSAADVNALLVRHGIPVHGLSSGTLRLESLFHDATGDHGDARVPA
ncbi:ABC transporter ATP-binding protein [Cognatilysobacter bugurensis]|uniref:ABC transporter ATP-binding protein n=1 Tax=Cognatilysobacter bugurensis TaxID=543356 RepID=A0A918T5T5_9GAMM|nr:ABC transporter ATP-binding protein [Lysobacter bugurensis]GHA86171.1 ABC transporter ATP-binding protein [Lysobacter bugurensis]